MGRRGDLKPGRSAGSRIKLRLLAGCAFAAAALVPAVASAQLVRDVAGTQVGGGGGPNITQTGAVTDVTLGAPRTILSWTSFSLGAGETVNYRFSGRTDIVLNKVSGQAVINGRVNALVGSQQGFGNVWFAAPGGVIFGAGAVVDVGGLLATSASVNPASFLDPSNFNFSFTGAGPSRVEVRAGADLKSTGGSIALVAGAVTSQAGSNITGGSGYTVLLAAANDFTIRFTPQPGDLDLLDFVVPAGGGTPSATPLALAGQAVGGNLILAVVNRADVASAVISATGVVAAQSAIVDHGDVVLTAGADVINHLPGAARNTTTTTTANVGVAAAQRDLVVAYAQPTNVVANQLTSGRDLGVLTANLDVGSLNAGRALAVDASGGITVRNGASAGATGLFRSNGAMTATGPINTVGRLQIDVGALNGGQVNSGRSIVANASGAGISITSGLAEDDILLTATGASGTVFLGSAFITGARNDEAPAGRTLQLTARGASGDVTYGANAGAPIMGATNVILDAGRDATANVSGTLTINRGNAGRTLTLRANDLEIAGPLTAPTVRIESLVGALTLGGTATGAPPAGALGAGADGLLVTDAEFQRITSTTGGTQFVAGSANSSARGDLTVRDLNVDPSKTQHLVLGAGLANDVLINGLLAPTVNGGTLAVGDASITGFQPGRILVAGQIGLSTGNAQAGFTGVRAFSDVSLSAARDIFLGTQRFIGLVVSLPADQIDISRGLPNGVAPTPAETDRLIVTADHLGLTAPNRIVQQNTGATGQTNGLYLANSGGETQVLSLSPADVVDIFGAYRDRNGVLRTTLTPGVVNVTPIPGQDLNDVRLNGCEVAACGSASSSTNSVKTLSVATYTPPTPGAGPIGQGGPSGGPGGGGGDSGNGGGDGGGGDQAENGESEPDANGEGTAIAAQTALMNIAQPDLTTVQGDPVTIGAGSDELWRNRRNPDAAPKP